MRVLVVIGGLTATGILLPDLRLPLLAVFWLWGMCVSVPAIARELLHTNPKGDAP